MHHIAIISASVRSGRNSHRVALFFKNFIEAHKLATVEILDLQAYDFPVFEERLQYQQQPSDAVLDFAGRIRRANGVLIVTPEYNGGYPASLKNVIDLLYAEWKRKPVAIASVSEGAFGGTQVVTSLVFTFWKIGALLVPAMYPVPNVRDAYDEQGQAAEAAATEKRARRFLDELVWCMDRVG